MELNVAIGNETYHQPESWALASKSTERKIIVIVGDTYREWDSSSTYNIVFSHLNYAPVNVNSLGPTRLTQGILTEKIFVCQNPHPAMDFICQNPHPKLLFLQMSDIIAIVRVRYLVRQTHIRLPWMI